MTKNLNFLIIPKFILLSFVFLTTANLFCKNTGNNTEKFREHLELCIRLSNINRVKNTLKNATISPKYKKVLLSLADETVEFRRTNFTLSKAGMFTGQRQERDMVSIFKPLIAAGSIVTLGFIAGAFADDFSPFGSSLIAGLATFLIWEKIRDMNDNEVLYENSVEIKKLIQQL